MTPIDKFKAEQGRAPDPIEAGQLRTQLDSIYKAFAAQLGGLRPPAEYALARLNTDTPNTRHSLSEGKAWAEVLPPLVLVGIGRDSVDWVDALYRGIFDRWPDDAGRAFYEGVRKGGASVALIAADMETNKAKGAT